LIKSFSSEIERFIYKLYYYNNKMDKHKCLKCGYEWYPRNPEVIPKQCPNCKRMDWNNPSTMIRKKPLSIKKLKDEVGE